MPDKRPLDSYARLGRREKRFYSIPLGKDREGRERHIALSDYNIDNGLPWRWLLYLALGEALIVVLSVLPPTSWLLGAFPPIARYSVFPIAISLGLTMWEPDGRPALGWLASVAYHRCTPRTKCAGKPVRPPGRTVIFGPVVAITPDLSGSSTPACALRGPATVQFTEGIVVTHGNNAQTHGVARPATPEDRDEHIVVERLDLDDGDTLTIEAGGS